MTGTHPFATADGISGTELCHGYTLASLHKLTMIAVLRDFWHRGLDLQERQELAWSAIAECLYASDGPPSRHDLIAAAQAAIAEQVRTDCTTRGISTQRGYADMPNFWRYWWEQARHTQGPEERVVDRLALAQIWGDLTPRHQRVLLALASHDDHELAAKSLGLSRSGYHEALSQARRAFYALWHEGERPSRLWASDHRGGKGTSGHSITNMIRRRARYRRAASAA